MGERTVALEFFNFVDEEGVGHTVMKGETFEFDGATEERGDRLGVFEDSPEAEGAVTDVEAAYGVSGIDPESGVAHLHTPPDVAEEAQVAQLYTDDAPEADPDDLPDPLSEDYPDLAEDVEAPEAGETTQGVESAHSVGESPKAGNGLSAADIDRLSGPALDQGCADAGLDTSQGGSLSDGSLSSSEKRDALKQHYGV